MIFKTAVFCAAGLAAAVMLQHLPAAAQAGDSPTGFFEKGYANSPADLNEPELARKAGPQAEPEPAPEETAQKPLKSPFLPKIRGMINDRLIPQSSSSSASSASTESRSEIVEPDGVKVNYLDFIINGNDVPHIIKNYKELVSLRDRFHLPIRSVFFVGDSTPLVKQAPVEVYSQGIKGGMFRYVPDVPEAFSAAKTSPTYVLETKDGSILMEGFASVARYLNSRGEFIEPDSFAAAEVKAAAAAASHGAK